MTTKKPWNRSHSLQSASARNKRRTLIFFFFSFSAVKGDSRGPAALTCWCVRGKKATERQNARKPPARYGWRQSVITYTFEAVKWEKGSFILVVSIIAGQTAAHVLPPPSGWYFRPVKNSLNWLDLNWFCSILRLCSFCEFSQKKYVKLSLWICVKVELRTAPTARIICHYKSNVI